eukprot:7383821-Prymnesium_polylepis.1
MDGHMRPCVCRHDSDACAVPLYCRRHHARRCCELSRHPSCLANEYIRQSCHGDGERNLVHDDPPSNGQMAAGQDRTQAGAGSQEAVEQGDTLDALGLTIQGRPRQVQRAGKWLEWGSFRSARERQSAPH